MDVEGQPSVLLIVALFVLRLGIPLLVTLGIAYALSRLDARWQRETEEQADERRSLPSERTRPGWPRVEIPFSASERPAPLTATAGPPCWSLKGCTEALKATCAACHQTDKPCWVARTMAEGQQPAECKGCNIYMERQPLWNAEQLLH
jgi:hypothetical protein